MPEFNKRHTPPLTKGYSSGPSLSTTQKVGHALNNTVIQSLSLLSLTQMDLQRFLILAAEQNPLLELDFSSELLCLGKDSLNRQDDQGFDDEFGYIRQNEDVDKFSYVKSSSYLMENLADKSDAEESLDQVLKSQIFGLRLDKETEKAVCTIISLLDENGYFTAGSNAAVKLSNCDYDCIEKAIKLVKSLQPRGVGASDLVECLTLQLDESNEHFALLKALISEDIEDLSKGNFNKVAAKHGIGHPLLQECLQVLKGLNPRPGADFAKAETQYIIPDIIIDKLDVGAQARVVGSQDQPLILNREYCNLADNASTNKGDRLFIKKHLQEAHRILAELKMRTQILERLAILILDYHYDYLMNTSNSLKPLTMSETAESLGVDISTVSRACKNKYIQAPRGQLAMRSLFSSSAHIKEQKTDTSVAKPVSVADIKQKIAHFVQTEDKNKPLSDEKIARLLTNESIDIARRTVTKHREALGIPAYRKRKMLGACKKVK